MDKSKSIDMLDARTDKDIPSLGMVPAGMLLVSAGPDAWGLKRADDHKAVQCLRIIKSRIPSDR